MKKLTFLFILLIAAVFIFFYASGRFSPGTQAQQTADPVEEFREDDFQTEEDRLEESDSSEESTTDSEEAETALDERDQQGPDSGLEDEGSETEIEVPIPGTEEYYKGVTVVDKPDHLTVLVNKKNVLKSDYEPSDLVKPEVFAPGRSEIEMFMREEAAEAVLELVNTAEEEENLEILPASAYRSYDLQTIIFKNNVSRKGSVEKANETSALPGQSEHQTGLAVDMSCSSVGYQINSSFGDTEEAEWLADNAHRFGFIIRYPEGKTKITGYNYEPWHLRYVGKDTAKSIYEEGLTLEEYLEKQ